MANASRSQLTGPQNYQNCDRNGANTQHSCLAAINNVLTASSEQGAKTSDLGDELPVNECENGIQALCHVAHLTLIDGCESGTIGGGQNVDSDGMSSETQRSFTTNGSPSSGVAEMELNPSQGQISCYKLASSAFTHTQQAPSTTSSSTIISCDHDQHQNQIGGSVISVTQQPDEQSMPTMLPKRSNLKMTNGNGSKHKNNSIMVSRFKFLF